MLLDQIEMRLVDRTCDHYRSVWIDVFDNSLSRKWLTALNNLLANAYHLEKNYCFVGFVDQPRDGPFILDRINETIQAINEANIGYRIDDHFTMDNCITNQAVGTRKVGRNIIHKKFNWLHRYFEDLQGVSGAISDYYHRADPATRWHIRQLNLLCHEFEIWALSWRKQIEAPEWQRPSQLMCWLNAPRFMLDQEDYELFGIETLNRSLGGCYVGVNKAVGKHHWEVFQDEGRDSRIGELVSTTLKSQTEAAGDFDIEWANDPGQNIWQKKRLVEFREWLLANGFDPEDPSLTIGHPKIGQVDLERSFGTTDYRHIWDVLVQHLDVLSISTTDQYQRFDYHWSDSDYRQQQIQHL